jgi:ketosteroid isomerase-like protein
VSQENVEVVRRLNDALNRGEVNEMEIRSFFHPAVEFLPRRSETEGAFHGLAGMERYHTDTEEIFEKFEPHYEFLDLGERVVAWGTIHVRARQSAIETDISMGGVFEFRDGKIVRFEDFGSKESALKAVGLVG